MNKLFKGDMRTLVLALLASASLIGCGTASAVDMKEATRIANLKASSEGYDLKMYEQPLVKYNRREDSWWVNYRKKGARYTEFSIEIENKTGRSSLVLP